MTEAHFAVGKPIPNGGELGLRAAQMANDTKWIPESFLADCYNYARVNFFEFPTSRHVQKAWEKQFREKHKALNPVVQIELKTKKRTQAADNDFLRGVAVIRMGQPYPVGTSEQVAKAKQPHTIEESEAWLEMFLEMPHQEGTNLEYWARYNKYGYNKGDLILAIGQKQPSDLVF
jgi:hypothetical protein